MIELQLFGRSFQIGRTSAGWQYRSVTASKAKRFRDLVFRAHPQWGPELKMSKVYLRNGYEIHLVPIELAHGLFYDIHVLKDGNRCSEEDPLHNPYPLSLYSEESADALLLYLQSKSKSLELTYVKHCLSRVYGVYSVLQTCLLWLSLLYNKIKDKALWQI